MALTLIHKALITEGLLCKGRYTSNTEKPCLKFCLTKLFIIHLTNGVAQNFGVEQVVFYLRRLFKLGQDVKFGQVPYQWCCIELSNRAGPLFPKNSSFQAFHKEERFVRQDLLKERVIQRKLI